MLLAVQSDNTVHTLQRWFIKSCISISTLNSKTSTYTCVRRYMQDFHTVEIYISMTLKLRWVFSKSNTICCINARCFTQPGTATVQMLNSYATILLCHPKLRSKVYIARQGKMALLPVSQYCTCTVQYSTVIESHY